MVEMSGTGMLVKFPEATLINYQVVAPRLKDVIVIVVYRLFVSGFNRTCNRWQRVCRIVGDDIVWGKVLSKCRLLGLMMSVTVIDGEIFELLQL